MIKTIREFFRHPWVLAFLITSAGVFAWPHLFFQGQIPLDGNTIREFYPTWCFSHAWHSVWTVPLWNPYRNMGEPYLADPQTMALYPFFGILKYLPTFTLFMGAWVLLHTFTAASGMIHLLKRWYPNVPSTWCLGAVLFSWNAFFTSRLTLLDHFASASYLPWILFFFLEESPLSLGAALALQWLAGFPPFSLISIVLIGVLALLKPRRTRTFIAGGAWALGFAALQWVPFVELLHYSSRPIFLSPAVALDFSESWHQLAVMLWVPQWYAFFPQLKGDPAVVSFYIGSFALLLSVWAVWKGKIRDLWIVIGIISGLILSTGSYARIPFFRVFRFPANWLLISTLGFSLLSAGGLDRIRRPWIRAFFLVGVVADLLLFSQYVRVPWFKESFLSAPPPLAIHLKTQIVPYRLYHTPLFDARYEHQHLDTLDDFQLAKDILAPSLCMAYGVREVSSYQVLTLTRAHRFQERLYRDGPMSQRLGWVGVSTVVTLPSDVVPVTPQSVRVVDLPHPVLPIFLLNGTSGHLDAWSESSTSASATVTLANPQKLIYSEVDYPGWHAMIDGRSVPLERLDDTFLEVLVPAGTHCVEFKFNSRTFEMGFVLTLAALFLYLGSALRGRFPTMLDKYRYALNGNGKTDA